MLIAGLSTGGAGPSQTPSIATTRCRLHAGTSVLIGGGPIANQREVQQGTVAQVTQGQHPGCIIPLKGNI